jgi:hypothetical protein
MAGEIQLNSTTMATESSGSITAELDTIRPNATNGSLTLQGDSSNAGVTGLTIDSSGVVNTTTAKVTNIQATSGQSLTIKDEDGNSAITVGTDNTAAGYLSLNFGSYHGDSGGAGSGTLSGNTLSDYEFGTWTPVFSGTGGSIGTTAYSERGGRYTKIGNRVILNFTMGLSSKGSWTGNVKITGIPFTGIGSLSGDEALSALEVRNTTISGKYCLLDLGRSSTTYLSPFEVNSASGTTIITVSNVQSNGFFRATMVYTTA